MPRLSKIGAAALAAFGWTGLASVSASYLVVAGGGAGGPYDGGGGGAGGYQTGTTSLNPTLSYTVTIGAGGAGQTSNTVATGNNGSNSQLGTLTASVGGGGGGSTGGGGSQNGAAGGSGGGGSYYNKSGGAGTAGQGNNGGVSTGFGFGGGGGGGAGAVGGAAVSSTQGGAGGVGLANPITGSTAGQLVSTTYYLAGGGGGGADPGTTTQALGGNGGGGNSAFSRGNNGTAGTANTGGGGGGGVESAQTGYSGGSGVVVISYPAPQQFGGGVVTTSGSNVIHTFNTSGTLTPLSSLTASYAVVAGGAGGGRENHTTGQGGGGGAGGLLTGSGLTIDANSIYVVTVGAGGTAGAAGTVGGNGTNSILSAYATAAVGGGGGGGGSSNPSNAGNGGSGGGQVNSLSSAGTGTSGQGNNGGASNAIGQGAGGGGGAGAVGGTATGGVNTSVGGVGGVGLANPITGSTTGQLVSSTYYLAGGGGGSGGAAGGGGPGGAGGSGGGGAGSHYNGSANGVAGTANTGGGGGGGDNNGHTSGAGGSGVVIISYAGSTQQMAGGTVTITGGNVIHTFTSSGYLTPIKYVNNSLRFRSSASASLSRTFPTAGDTKTWTWSAWVKRGTMGAINQYLFALGSSQTYIIFNSDNIQVGFYSTNASTLYYTTTSQVFRDPAAWYHIVVAIDTTQATAANRNRLYINGVQVTAFSAATYPSQNDVGQINTAALHRIGSYDGSTNLFDGYMTEVNFVNAQQLTPNSFGTFNSYGVWQPITYGGSYGTNGFYLPFTNTTSATTLAYDFSPNGNNWTPTNISTSTGVTYDSMTDVPTLTSATAANYATLNPLAVGSSGTLSDGSLKIAGVNSANVGASYSTIGMITGKWYFEITAVGVGSNFTYALVEDVLDTSALNVSGSIFAGYRSTGDTYGTVSITTTTWNSAGVVIGVAVDCDNGAIYFANANTWINSGVPTSGASRTGAITTYTAGTKTLFGGVGCYQSSSQSAAINFGQRPFSYTPPTGFVALNTYNL